MGRQLPLMVLVDRFAGWLHQAQMGHRVLRELVVEGTEVDTPQNGSITIKVPYIAWTAARAEANKPPPEPVDLPDGDIPETASSTMIKP